MARDSGGKLTENEAKRIVTLARSSYQPGKAELGEAIEFPEGTTPDDLAQAVMRLVDSRWKSRPE